MGVRHITRAQLKILLDAGWKTTPASLYEPDHAPDAQFVIVDDMPAQAFRRLHPPKESTK